VLQERAFERLGGTETLRIEARLIALTNVDLTAAVAAGRFREDLFFRLNVLTLHVPPLRTRRADILPLADHLLASVRGVHGRPAELSEMSRKMLVAYDWPGNVREVRNALERAVVFTRTELLEPRDFPETVRASAPGFGGSSLHLRSLEDIEKEAIAATLEATHFKIGRAAEILGISRKTLLEKRKKYQLK
jgi:DNA-binding NtrC family response regulator